MFGRNQNRNPDFPKPAGDGEMEKLTKMVTDLTGQMTQMTQFVQSLQTNQQQLNQVMSQFDREMGGMRGQSQTGRDMTELNLEELEKQKEKPLTSVYDLGQEDFDAIPANQRYKMLEDGILSKVEKALGDAMKPLTDQLTNTQNLIGKNQTQSELDTLRSATGEDGKPLKPDFNDWLPAMAKLREKPEFAKLPLQALYDVARGADPKKATELSEKYAPKKEEMREFRFGGLTSDLAPESTETGDLSVEEASLQAAKEYLSENGGSPFSVDEIHELDMGNQDMFA